MRPPIADRQAGFALVESIAVLALSGLVLLTLVIATDLVSRNSAAAARSANAIETLTMGLGAVRRDLQGAQFIRVGASEEDPILFSGAPQAVAIAVENDGTGTNDGEALVLIEARYEDGRGVLIRSSAKLRPGASGFGGAAFENHAVIMSGPWRYRFAYSDPQAGTERWRNEWTAANRMPSAIRLDVLSEDGNQVIPSLVVRMRVESGGCADPAKIECVAAQQVDQNQGQNENNENGTNENPEEGGDPNNGQ